MCTRPSDDYPRQWKRYPSWVRCLPSSARSNNPLWCTLLDTYLNHRVWLTCQELHGVQTEGAELSGANRWLFGIEIVQMSTITNCTEWGHVWQTLTMATVRLIGSIIGTFTYIMYSRMATYKPSVAKVLIALFKAVILLATVLKTSIAFSRLLSTSINAGPANFNKRS